MIGSEDGRVASEDGLDRRVLFESFVEKVADVGAIPSLGVVEIRIELKIAAVELTGRLKMARLRKLMQS